MSNSNQEPSHDESLSNLPAGATDVSLGEGQKGKQYFFRPVDTSLLCRVPSVF
jgi:hypothetical protein